MSYSYQQWAPDASPPWDSSSYNPASDQGQNGDVSGSFDGRSFASGSVFGGINPSQIKRMFLIHGILAAVAFAFLFPLGAILLRVIPGRMSVYVHAGTQMVALVVYSGAFGIGVHYATQIAFGRFRLIDNYHAIIGIVVFALVGSQPFTGLIHHLKFMRLRRRTFWSHVHRLLGMSGIALGIINGGLGLMLAGAPDSFKIAYGVVAGIMASAVLMASIWSSVQRHRAMQQQHVHPAHRRRAGGSNASSDRGSGGNKESSRKSRSSRKSSEPDV